jgi:hypothetical protein
MASPSLFGARSNDLGSLTRRMRTVWLFLKPDAVNAYAEGV